MFVFLQFSDIPYPVYYTAVNSLPRVASYRHELPKTQTSCPAAAVVQGGLNDLQSGAVPSIVGAEKHDRQGSDRGTYIKEMILAHPVLFVARMTAL